MVTLTGTGRIADDLYLLAHDDATGRPFLQSRALGAGLAGALLAELTFAGAVWIRPEGIEFTRRGAPKDDLGRHVLRLLLAEGNWHPLRDWLTFLGLTAEEHVARRLSRAGYLDQASSRWPRRRPRWVPADPDCAFAPMIRVKAVMAQTSPATVSDVALAGMALACGLGSRVLPYGPAGARSNVESSVRKLHPGLRELIACTQAAVDGALLSQRV